MIEACTKCNGDGNDGRWKWLILPGVGVWEGFIEEVTSEGEFSS